MHFDSQPSILSQFFQVTSVSKAQYLHEVSGPWTRSCRLFYLVTSTFSTMKWKKDGCEAESGVSCLELADWAPEFDNSSRERFPFFLFQAWKMPFFCFSYPLFPAISLRDCLRGGI